MAAFMNTSNFLKTIKENVGLDDLPQPVTDQELLERLERSSLIDFSILAPNVKRIYLNDDNIVKLDNIPNGSTLKYSIPPYEYSGVSILSVSLFEPVGFSSYGDQYDNPIYNYRQDTALLGLAAVHQAADISSNTIPSVSHQFTKPNIIIAKNAFRSTTYEAELLLSHPISLATIPDDCWIELKQLATLDIKWFLYNKLKRKNLDVGVGTFDLKIDEWSSAESDYNALLKEWEDSGAAMDFTHLKYI